MMDISSVTAAMGASASSGQKSSKRDHPDSYLAAKYWVEVDSDSKAAFTECSGLSADTDVLEYAEGGLNDHVHKLAGRTRFSNITLRRGWALTDELWKWYEQVVQGKIKRKTVSIIMYENKGENAGDEVAHWVLEEAYPVKYHGPEFRSDSNAVAIETVELAHSGWRRQK